jgi:predicted RecA/RadA family phage recombinase
MARKISDGKSVVVTAPNAVSEGDVVFDPVSGWGGIAFQDAESGEEVAINIEQAEYGDLELTVIAGSTLSEGGFVYYNTTEGRIDNDNRGLCVGKVTDLYEGDIDNMGGVEAVTTTGAIILMPQIAGGLA